MLPLLAAFPAQKVNVIDLVGLDFLNPVSQSSKVVERPVNGLRLQDLFQFGKENIQAEGNRLSVGINVEYALLVDFSTGYYIFQSPYPSLQGIQAM